MELRKRDLEKKLNMEYASKLQFIKNETKKLWTKDTFCHLYYTIHGMEHSNRVIERLNSLVACLYPRVRLEEVEIFCLLSAAYLHDVGMLIEYESDNEKAKKISESKNELYTSQDVIRDEHHIRSKAYIMENYQALGLNHAEAEPIGLISEGHRKIDLNNGQNYERIIVSNRIRVRLLSALLRLADELDIDFTRFPNKLYEILNKNMPSFSKLQWLKHYYTDGVIIDLITRGDKGFISIKIEFSYPNEVKGQILCDDLVLKPINKTIKEVENTFLSYNLTIKLDYIIIRRPDLEEIPDDLLIYIPRNSSVIELLKNLAELNKSKEIFEERAYWGKESDSWIKEFHSRLNEYHHIYAFNNYYRSSLYSSRYNKFLREQYKVRLLKLKSSPDYSLSFSSQIRAAINRTGWTPDKILWPNNTFIDSNLDSSNELEIVRILPRPSANLQDHLILENADYDHKLHAIPLFVYDDKQISVDNEQITISEMSDFVIGFDNYGVIIKAYQFNLTKSKVSEVDYDTARYLVKIFEKMVESDSLKTVDKFIEMSESIRTS